jgi:N-acyl amino acid synthase of PEP-CTERM/exosortase system
MENLAPPQATASAPIKKRALAEVYRELFEAIPADTPELRRQAHRLRYQVYCVENSYEDPAANPTGMEHDEFDGHSVQGILLHRPSELVVGTVRLVLHDPGASVGALPIHKVCRDPRAYDPDILPPASTCELSRFAISKTFRRRAGDGKYGRTEDPDELAMDARRIIPHITLGLMTVALQMAIPQGVDTVCAVMEPALLRMVARFGLHFTLLGPPVAYHGWRQPCYSPVSDLLAGVEIEHPEVWDIITEGGRLWPRTVGVDSLRMREAV